MKRVLASALIIGFSTLGLVGCGEETKVKDEVSTPSGTKTTELKTTTTGDGAAGAVAPGASGAPVK